MISTRLVCISGFKQSMARPNGIEKVWLQLRKHESQSCRVSYKEWDTPWPEFAEHILRTGPTDPRSMTIRVFAYSWGCGYGSLNLFKQLKHRGFSVRSAVFADPVYYNWYAPWRAIWSPIIEPTIQIPDNVDEVWYYRQQENKPSGHRVVQGKGNCHTVIHKPVFLSRSHEFMDEDPAFAAQCMEVAREASEPNSDSRGNS